MTGGDISAQVGGHAGGLQRGGVPVEQRLKHCVNLSFSLAV